MVRLYPLTYKNYYNRIAQKLPTIADYAAHICAGASYLPQIDFDPKDGVDTTQIIGTGAAPYTGDVPDYVLITDTHGTNILSRWYVIEAKYNRKGQYKLTLHRDFWADFREDLLNSPAFIRKGWVSKNDPAIFNTEQMTFNQIKKSETLIKGEFENGFIVGYFTKGSTDQTITIYPDNDVPAGTYASADLFPANTYTKIVDKNGNVTQTGSYAFIGVTGGSPVYNFYCPGIGDTSHFFAVWSNGAEMLADPPIDPSTYTATGSQASIEETLRTYTPLQQAIPDLISTFLNEVANNAVDLYQYDGRLYVINGKTYRASLEFAYESETVLKVTSSTYPLTYTAMGNAITGATGITGSASNSTFHFETARIKQKLILTEETSTATTIVIKPTVKTLSDAPYSMFCLPVGGYEYVNGSTCFIQSKIALKIASAIQEQLGAACYDIQYLPYCPRRDFIANHKLNVGQNGGVTYGTNDEDYTLIKDSNSNAVAALVYASQSSFQLESNYSMSVSSDDREFKVNHETLFIRICSPNYNGQFEMTAEENYGINGLIINCTYKPFNPFIQVIPKFKGLYGSNFQDARGLICSGDWSLPQVADAWVNYELQNKNYQQSFNRNIQSLELRNKYARTGDILNAVTGTVGAGVTGATAGAAAGPVGAIVGGVIGTAGGAATGIADVSISEDLRRDNIDLAKDQFGYRLGNIQAVPDSLTRISALNNCFKVFPFVEVFEATETEKQALRDKIKYDGMSIGRIGNIAQFRVMNDLKMVKGTFIRITGIEDDYHVFRAINEEFERGVFI